MYNLNSKAEGKQYFKAKVGVLMQEYERNKQEEMVQKQKMKQNIMLQIMTNRHKPQIAQSPPSAKESQTDHTVPSDDNVEENPGQSNMYTFNMNRDKSRPEVQNASHIMTKNQEEKFKAEEEEQKGKFEETTFNMKKRNKALKDQLNGNKTVQVQEEGNEGDQPSSFDKSKDRIAKLANKYFPSGLRQEPEEIEKSQNEDSEEEQEVEGKNYAYLNNPSFLRQDMSDIHSSHLKKTEMSQPYQPEPEEGDEQAELEEQIVPEDENRGVFLTMEQSQSMTAEQMPKNYAFQIKMDKSNNPDHLEELRKQKIKQMEKKRQERIEEYRKQESQKKIQQPKQRNSLTTSKHQKHEKQIVHEIEIPKSNQIQRKSNMHRPPKMQNRSEREHKNQLIPLEQQEQQVKPIKNNKNSYLAKHQQQIKHNGFKQPVYEEQPYKPVSPMRTPKTIVSENRSKSGQRNSNIFQGQSQYQRQRSSQRMQEPKIEPKERKNSFNRQSNKKLMMNAITHVFLPGELNRKQRERHLQVLQTSQHQFFIFLFKEYSRKVIKGIYALDNTQMRLQRIFGDKAPYEITADRVQYFYRFDSGSREFKKVDGCRSFSLAIHAIDLK